MTDIIDLLRKRLDVLKKELETLQQERDKIETRMAEVVALYEATRAVLEHELKEEGLSQNTEASWTAVRSKIRTMTLKDAIYTIVKTQGGEDGIHANTILEKLKEAGFPIKSQTPKTSITSTIYLNTRDHGTYEKVRPNTFKLAEIQEAAVQEQLISVQND